MSNKFQDFQTKLKENRKFQIQFVSVMVSTRESEPTGKSLTALSPAKA